MSLKIKLSMEIIANESDNSFGQGQASVIGVLNFVYVN
jgi:hypothetical protein